MKRKQWIDVAKAIGILLVVFGHVDRGLVNSGVMPATNLFFVTDYTVYTFHMPLFFLLSGLTIQLQTQKLDHVIFSRLLLLVYAYFLWSSGQLLLQISFSNYVNYPASLSDLERIFFAPTGQFWFLYALLICHLIFLVTSEKTVLIVLALLIFTPVQFAGLGIVSTAAHFFPYYAAGLLFARQIVSWRLSLVVLISLVAMFAIAAALNWAIGGHYRSLGALPAACLGIAVVLAGSKLIAGRLAAALALIGRLSLPIFLVHVIAASAIRVAMISLGVPQDAVLYIVCGITAGIAFPMLLYWALSHLRLLPLFGFAPFAIYPTKTVKSRSNKPA